MNGCTILLIKVKIMILGAGLGDCMI